jgi:hypothetical protein
LALTEAPHPLLRVAMSFFGLTYLGSGNVFRNTRANRLDGLLAIPTEAFVDAFHAMSLERTRPRLAGTIGVDGGSFMMRGELPELMERVLGRVPEREELDVFLTFFDITATGVVDVKEFQDGIGRMKTRSEHPASSRNYDSSIQMRADRAKNRRHGVDPQMAYAKPLLASQEYGWHTQQARPSDIGFRREFRGVQKTDVTLNEGRSLQSYFGEM